MKVKLGMKVGGEISQGTVVAMTKEWCIYSDDALAAKGRRREIAEQWDTIVILAEKPDAIEGSLNESPVDVPEEK